MDLWAECHDIRIGAASLALCMPCQTTTTVLLFASNIALSAPRRRDRNTNKIIRLLSGALSFSLSLLTFFPELAFVLVFVHRLGGAPVLAARAGELAGDQGARAVVPQVVVEVPALQNLGAGVRVRARHRLLVEEPAVKYCG